MKARALNTSWAMLKSEGAFSGFLENGFRGRLRPAAMRWVERRGLRRVEGVQLA